MSLQISGARSRDKSCHFSQGSSVGCVCLADGWRERDLGSSGVEEDEGKRMELRRKESSGSDTD